MPNKETGRVKPFLGKLEDRRLFFNYIGCMIVFENEKIETFWRASDIHKKRTLEKKYEQKQWNQTNSRAF